MPKLDEDCYLAYYLPHEAYYADTLTRHEIDDKPYIMICSASRGGGVAWEFKVAEYDLSGPTTQIEMFADSFDAFAQIPEFFSAITANPPKTLDAVRYLLDSLGAVDNTPRTNPHR